MRHWDVIILGAGPAGLALAARLAPDHQVLVIERADALPQTPRIGESLTASAQVLLERLGIFQDFLQDGHQLRAATVSAWNSDVPVWQDSLRDPAGPGWVLDRRRFEARLAQTALARGATIAYGQQDVQLSFVPNKQSTHGVWQLQGTAERDSAPIVIDATGRSASAARALGVRQHKLDHQICLHAFYQTHAPTPPITRISAVAEGWWYQVGLGAGIGVVALHLDARAPLRQTLTNSVAFNARAQACDLLCEPLRGADFSALQLRPAGTCVLDIAGLTHCPPGFLAIGDALISFDPIAAQGLFHALASAESAYQAITQNLSTNPQARQMFIDEQLQVAAHYLKKLTEVYRAPTRFSHQSYWRQRARLLQPQM